MERYTAISLIAITVIILAAFYSVLGIDAVNNLQMQWYDKGMFSFDALQMIGGTVYLCNDSFVPLDAKKYTITVLHEQKNAGKFTLDRLAMNPYEKSEIFFELENNELPLRLPTLDSDVLQSLEDSQSNAKDYAVIVNAEIRFIGLIPIQVTNEYSGEEFLNLMNDKDGTFGC